MDARDVTVPDSETVQLGPSRTRTLQVLQDADNPLGVQEVAELVGLHVNTARFHLDGLVEAGLATRTREDRSEPGRPRIVYTAEPTGRQVGQRSYRLLSEILVSFLAASVRRPTDGALEAGRAWGRYLTERPAPFQQMDAGTSLDHLMQILADVGFDPEAAGTKQRPQIRLRHCPFREVAKTHSDVVCSIHLGLMQGALAEMRAPVTADRLEPFIEPSLCLSHLTRR
ncbi:MAG TPA: helix-turn-helix domain-containing protein [Nocardioidaceae bacterium]|nr:helix-turn-helix domain-containing protein [Nocardioidaceae bacterium]